MKGNYFLFWFLVLFLSVVLALEGPTCTTNWRNSSPDDSHQEESLANEWFKYPSGHWRRKFHYGCSTTPPPPAKTLLVRPNAYFYLLMYLVGYRLLGRFSSMMGRFAYPGHFGHLAMVKVPIGALAHKIRDLFPFKLVPDNRWGCESEWQVPTGEQSWFPPIEGKGTQMLPQQGEHSSHVQESTNPCHHKSGS
ncbi:hypothetical protein DSO57_1037900 [Entomophthora muscae]|uniref:Uncharacterized protein n=1 Tax=Entomophthora muscae TaxID=34485 RepID=A0ACC2UKI0_9FUNG|nr:hypothetical protein DSO57_1037900 [Entomophthora muscae]